jgi:hypothetical protein
MEFEGPQEFKGIVGRKPLPLSPFPGTHFHGPEEWFRDGIPPEMLGVDTDPGRICGFPAIEGTDGVLVGDTGLSITPYDDGVLVGDAVVLPPQEVDGVLVGDAVVLPPQEVDGVLVGDEPSMPEEAGDGVLVGDEEVGWNVYLDGVLVYDQGTVETLLCGGARPNVVSAYTVVVAGFDPCTHLHGDYLCNQFVQATGGCTITGQLGANTAELRFFTDLDPELRLSFPGLGLWAGTCLTWDPEAATNLFTRTFQGAFCGSPATMTVLTEYV